MLDDRRAVPTFFWRDGSERGLMESPTPTFSSEAQPK